MGALRWSARARDRVLHEARSDCIAICEKKVKKEASWVDLRGLEGKRPSMLKAVSSK